MQYGRKCLVCKNTRQREPGCRLFKFPARGSPMWYRWLEACRLRDEEIDVSSREPPRLCQRHFQRKDFLTRQLTGTAIPSIFPMTVFTELNGRLAARDEQQDQVIVNSFQLDEATTPKDEVFNDVIEYSESLAEGFENETVVNEGNLSAVIITRNSAHVKVEAMQPLNVSCNIDDHRRLSDDLIAERAKIQLLARELVEKDRIIREQYELLKQLGVQLITFTDV